VRIEHISPWFFPQCLATHLSPIDVEMETQHANIALKPCALGMDSQHMTTNGNLLQCIRLGLQKRHVVLSQFCYKVTSCEKN
jgi:hypothetical protein